MLSNKTRLTTSEDIHVKRHKSETLKIFTSGSLKKPEDIIVCEKQESLYCGRHVLRAVSQRLDLFTDTYLKEIAQNLAGFEQIYSHEESVRITDYYYEHTGEYNIDVLKAALLNIFNIDLVQIDRLEGHISSLHTLIVSNITNIQALIIQQDYHYYCLRRFRLTKDYFFVIDSKNSTFHQSIHCDNILNYFATILLSSGNIFVLMKRISDTDQNEICEHDIATVLWPLPETPADLEVLIPTQRDQ